MRVVLNVGGGSKSIAIPSRYDGWRHDLLDIDPAGFPDIVLDARKMTTLPAAWADAIYCSHNLEHYHRHECAVVIDGFSHVLKSDGFVEVRAPDIQAVMKHVVEHDLDIDDELYQSPRGPVSVGDVFYGHHDTIEENANDFYAHKTGFTANSLARLFSSRHFPFTAVGTIGFELIGFFFKNQPTGDHVRMLGLTLPEGSTKDGSVATDR